MPKSSSSSSKKGGGQRFLPAVINPLVPKQPSILPDPNDPLSRYAGVRGRPMEVDPAARDANPNYAKGEEYRTNCQRCIWAYEMRRRGYDVEAKPRTRSMTDPAYNRGWTTFMFVCVTGKHPHAEGRGEADGILGRGCPRSSADHL